MQANTPPNSPIKPLAVPQLGAIADDTGTTFRLWTTLASEAGVILYGADFHEERRPLESLGNGLFEARFQDVRAGDRYQFELDKKPLPDPYARCLPEGPHGPALVWRSSYEFKRLAPSLRADQLVIYELHVGTFTPEGTYAAATEKLGHLKELGVNCIELLPLAASAGSRNWGYDGVAPFAPFAPYGSPDELQQFVDAAHGQGLIVLLDTVYNHFGPSGNYLSAYSPQYYTGKAKTPWGDSLDYQNQYLRKMLLDSAEHWLRTFRVDGFRLDATHEIHDPGEPHFLEELANRVHALKQEMGTNHFMFCEDDRNWPGLVTRFHMDGMWADDFHHQTRILLTGEQDGYFAAYEPTVAALANCINRGWTYEGQQWTVGQHRHRGNPADELKASNFVYTIQNHDQIGNRAVGDRLQEKAGPDGFLAASALLLFLPMTPLLFQGQEWMASTPFLYFTDHDGDLGRAITVGRAKEFEHFESFAGVDVPDPQAVETFEKSKLDWDEASQPGHAKVLALYRTLLAMRKDDPVLGHSSRNDLKAAADGEVLIVDRWHAGQTRRLLVNFGKTAANVEKHLPAGAKVRINTGDFTANTLGPKSTVIVAFG
jgi:maltooligosyltrehalose trehalohydrolase